MQGQRAYLLLENGRVFCGTGFGATGDVTGELVFTTGMTGYLETLTDPSFYGQIVLQTFPSIGNYGVIPSDFEHKTPSLSAYIVRHWCQEPSNFRCEGTLDTFLKQNNIIGIHNIDTRALTKIVREAGVMNARITTTPPAPGDEQALKKYAIVKAVEAVTCKESKTYGESDAKYRVVLWDFGARANIRRELLKRGCSVIQVGAHTTADEIAALKPDGVMLSNGPGDPAQNVEIIGEVARLFEKCIPMFGVCLGHQLMALACGAKTEKLKYGHRGSNQPAIEVNTRRIFVTSQNHGYSVISSTLPDRAIETFVNGNDGTCEGIEYTDLPAFSVQFHPESAAGPQGSGFLFDRFFAIMEEVRKNAAQ